MTGDFGSSTRLANQLRDTTSQDALGFKCRMMMMMMMMMMVMKMIMLT